MRLPPLLLPLTLISLLATSLDVGAQQGPGSGSGPNVTRGRLRPILGLRRIVTPDDDLEIDQLSISSVQQGLEIIDDQWPLTDGDDNYAYGQLDTAAVGSAGRSENHMEHSILAFPVETSLLNMPQIGDVSAAYHAVQLQSAGLDQGYVEIFGEPTGDVAGSWAASASHTTVVGSFGVVVDPIMDLQTLPGATLRVRSRFWLSFSGLPAGVLEDGALLRKDIGDSYVQAIYSKAADRWEISGFLCGGIGSFMQYQQGQDLSFGARAVQVVAEGETLEVFELTDYCIAISANDGPGPDLMGMQFSVINSGFGGLHL